MKNYNFVLNNIESLEQMQMYAVIEGLSLKEFILKYGYSTQVNIYVVLAKKIFIFNNNFELEFVH